MTIPRGRPSGVRRDPRVRLMERVTVVGACWLWTGPRDRLGYGVMSIKTETETIVNAHRASWFVYNGAIPEGMHVCHTCDVRHCVNPAHLFLGTHMDNMRDMVAKGRSPRRRVALTHCKWGHPFSGDNLVITSEGKRGCRACMQRHSKAQAARKKAARLDFLGTHFEGRTLREKNAMASMVGA